jgi:hypothetical protein
MDVDPAELGLPAFSADRTPRARAMAALWRGDWLAAVDEMHVMGDLTYEAFLRMRLGERLLDEGRGDDGAEHLERSLAFWRSVRATRFIRECDALLAGSAQRSA